MSIIYFFFFFIYINRSRESNFLKNKNYKCGAQLTVEVHNLSFFGVAKTEHGP